MVGLCSRIFSFIVTFVVIFNTKTSNEPMLDFRRLKYNDVNRMKVRMNKKTGKNIKRIFNK